MLSQLPADRRPLATMLPGWLRNFLPSNSMQCNKNILKLNIQSVFGGSMFHLQRCQVAVGLVAVGCATKARVPNP